MNVGLQRVAK